MAVNTKNLGIRLIQPTDKFIDVTFNNVIKDIDSLCLSVNHADSTAHFSVWKANTNYDVKDIVRISKNKSNQYYKCIVSGTTSGTEPKNNVSGSIVVDGSVKWLVSEIGGDIDSANVNLWQANTYYEKGSLVLYKSTIYRCKVSNNSSNSFSSDINCWQQLFSNIQPWLENTYYSVNDNVVYGGKIYGCTTAHTSTTTFDLTKFELLSDFGLVHDYTQSTGYEKGQIITYNGTYYVSNLKFTSDSTSFINDAQYLDLLYASINKWQPYTYYKKDSVIINDDLIYRCVSDNTSTTGFEADRANWVLIGNVPANLSNWNTKTYYYKNQCVVVDGIIYRSKSDHMSGTTFSSESTSWEMIGGVGGATTWEPNKPYQEGQFILNDNILYRCNTKHTSNSVDFKTDDSKWDILNTSIPVWSANNYYKTGTVVINDNLFYMASTSATSSTNFETDRANWILLSNVPAYLSDWVSSKYYYTGQCVLNGNSIYQCTNSHMSASSWSSDSSDWKEIGSGTINEWQPSKDYLDKDVVINNNRIYKCVNNHTSSNNFYSDYQSKNWEEISKTQIDNWNQNLVYYVGDIVSYDKQLYRCITSHTSTTDFPTDYNAGNWELVVEVIGDWKQNKTYSIGQLVINGGSLYECALAHTSSTNFKGDYDNGNWKYIGYKGIKDWEPSSKYVKDDFVIYDNNIYRCKTNHNSTSFDNDISDWELISTITIGDNWQSNKLYLVNQIVYYDNKPYRSTSSHISKSTFDVDSSDFELLYSSIKSFEKDIYYMTGDTVIYDKAIYQCLTNHVEKNDTPISALTKSDINNFTITDSGQNAIVSVNKSYTIDLGSIKNISNIDWEFAGSNLGVAEFTVSISNDNSTYTQVSYYYNANAREGQHDTIYVNNNARYIKFDVTKLNSLSSSGHLGLNCYIYEYGAEWKKIADDSLSFTEWKQNHNYSVNDSVTYKGIQYVCIRNNNSGSTFNFDNWKPVGTHISDWHKNVRYIEGDTVYYNNILYKCNTPHTSLADFEQNKWEIVNSTIPNWIQNKWYKENQLVQYNKDIYRCTKANDSEYFLKSEWEPADKRLRVWESGHDSKLLSLLDFEESITKDESGTKWKATGTVQKSNSIYKFGTGSLAIPTSNSYIYINNFLNVVNNQNANTIKTTISFYVNMTGNNNNIIQILGTKINPATYPQFVISQWNNIELDIDSGVITIFIEGHKAGTLNIGTTQLQDLYLGLIDGSNNPAYFDEFYIYNDVLHTNDFNIDNTPIDFGKYYYYEVGDFVEYNDKIYRCIEKNNDLTFNINHWAMTTVDIALLDWKPSTSYSKYSIVAYDGMILRCNTNHLSDTSYTHKESEQWDILSSGTIDLWQPNKHYAVGNIVINDDILYRCNTSHTSTNKFVDNYYYFTEIGGGSNGGFSGYKQLSKIDLVAPKEYDITIPKTKNFLLPPLEVLKLTNSTTTTVTECEFNNGDSTDFDYNQAYVKFDGVMKLNTEFVLDSKAVSMGNGTLVITDNYIDVSDFKSIDSVSVNNDNTTTVKAVPKAQIIKPKDMLPISNAQGIGNVNLKVNTSSGVNIRVAVTKNLADYYVFDKNTNQFVIIDIDKDFAAKGMIPSDLPQITKSDWKTFTNNGEDDIGFAYYLDISHSTDVAEVDTLTVDLTLNGIWKKSVYGTDYEYGYLTNQILRLDILKDGSYKINYPVPTLGDNIDDDWATKRQARAYAISLG